MAKSVGYTVSPILVADDRPVRTSVVPWARGDAESVPAIQHELLVAHRRRNTHKDLRFETRVRHKGVPADEGARRRLAIGAELRPRNHSCLRASALPRRSRWSGVHDEADAVTDRTRL